MFCKSKDIFGKPGTGFHKLHVGGVAIGDFLLTLVLAWITSYVSEIPLTITVIGWLVIAVVFHKIFCVETSVTKYLNI